MVKMTVTIDDETARTLKAMAERFGKSPSLVLSDVIAEYAARAGRMTEAERRQMRDEVDAVTKRPATRSDTELDREIETLRHNGVLGRRRRRG